MRTSVSSSRAGALAPLAGASDARAVSAVSASTYTVPLGFLWLSDVVMQSGAFLLAWWLSPVTQWLSSADWAGRLPWLAGLSLRPAAEAAGSRPFAEIAWIPLVMVPVTLVFVHLLGGYRPLLERSLTRVVLSSLAAPLLGLSLVTLILILVRHQSTSRAFIFSFTLFSGLALLACRLAIRTYKHRRLLAGHYARNVVVVSGSSGRNWLSRHFAANVSPHLYRLYGYFDGPEMPNADESGADEVPLTRLGQVEDLGDLLIHRPIHEVVAVQSPGSDEWLPKVIEQCEYFQVTLRLVPGALLSWQSRDLQVLFRGAPLQLPEIVLRPRHIDSSALFAKRVFDMVVSGGLLILLSPIFILVALAIKLTTPRLPVFYPWRVIGYKGRPFTGYKFTTMAADADQRKPELMHLNEMSGPVFKIKHDPRITPLGKILRKFSLNELPQLWSVLKGDMSLVGPRPAYSHELERYELWQKRKLCVQPGMTCLWQVRGRNKISNFDDWVRMDFEYIDNWSLWLDCKILFKTVFAVVGGSGS